MPPTRTGNIVAFMFLLEEVKEQYGAAGSAAVVGIILPTIADWDEQYDTDLHWLSFGAFFLTTPPHPQRY